MSAPAFESKGVAIVTGCSSGIGRSIALTLAKNNYSVSLAARRLPLLETLKAEILHLCPNVKVECIATDVTVRSDVQNLVEQTASLIGKINVMVNCAGVMYFTLMKNCNMDEWDRTVDINIKGVLHGFGSVIPHFVANGGGHIVTISSDAGMRIFPTLAVYCASKTFVEVLSEGTRRELIGTGIKVTTILPGDVKGTELIMQNTDKEAAESIGVAIGGKVGEGAKREEMLDPQDIADAVLYAVNAPKHVAVNTVLVEARDQE